MTPNTQIRHSIANLNSQFEELAILTLDVGIPSDDCLNSRDLEELREELETAKQEAEELIDLVDSENKKGYSEELTALADRVKAALQDWQASESHKLYEELEVCAGAGISDWLHGETLINENHFTAYIEGLIDDCYEMPEGFKSGEWPWRHMSIDFEAAANEAKADYQDVTIGGKTYLVRT